jgi:hypothetical protein
MDKCERCGQLVFIGQWPWCPHGWLRTQDATAFDPVVYHVNQQGQVRFPGSVDAPVPAGYEKRELRTVGEVRAFQRRVNQTETSKIRQSVEAECAWLEHLESTTRADLRQAMQRMSPRGRAFAELAIAQHNATRPTSRDADFYVEAFEMDASNREGYRDERTQWRPKRR